MAMQELCAFTPRLAPLAEICARKPSAGQSGHAEHVRGLPEPAAVGVLDATWEPCSLTSSEHGSREHHEAVANGNFQSIMRFQVRKAHQVFCRTQRGRTAAHVSGHAPRIARGAHPHCNDLPGSNEAAEKLLNTSAAKIKAAAVCDVPFKDGHPDLLPPGC